MKLKLNLQDYKNLFKEAIPFGIPAILDYRMKKIIEKDSEHLFSKDNLEHTKDLAMTIKQQLILDPKYNSFYPLRKSDGVLTKKTKEYVLSIADKLEEMKRHEIMAKYHKAVDKGQVPLEDIEDHITSEPKIVVIPPEI